MRPSPSAPASPCSAVILGSQSQRPTGCSAPHHLLSFNHTSDKKSLPWKGLPSSSTSDQAKPQASMCLEIYHPQTLFKRSTAGRGPPLLTSTDYLFLRSLHTWNDLFNVTCLSCQTQLPTPAPSTVPRQEASRNA